MNTFIPSEAMELAIRRATQTVTEISGRICRRQTFGQKPEARRLARAEMLALAREARRVAADLTCFAAHIDRTIGDKR